MKEIFIIVPSQSCDKWERRKRAHRQEAHRLISKTVASVTSEKLLCEGERSHSKQGPQWTASGCVSSEAGGWGDASSTVEVCSPHCDCTREKKPLLLLLPVFQSFFSGGQASRWKATPPRQIPAINQRGTPGRCGGLTTRTMNSCPQREPGTLTNPGKCLPMVDVCYKWLHKTHISLVSLDCCTF